MTIRKYLERRVLAGMEFWNEFKRDKTALLGLGILIVATLSAIGAPLIARFDPWAMVSNPLSQPSAKHWFGTDALGRDVFSRVIWGTRVSLLFGVVSAGLSGFLGIIIGGIPAYFGGWVDDLTSRITEFILVIPTIFVLILLVSLFGSNLNIMMLVIGATMWPWIARIMRAQVLSIKSKPYVLAAVGTGASNLRVIFRHVLPNGLYPVIANIFLQMAFAVLTEAGLSFLALGDVNRVSWGQILYWGHTHIRTMIWDTLLAGAVIVILAAGFTFVGDGLNNALNPRLRESR